MTPKIWLLLGCSMIGYALAEYWSKLWSLAPGRLLACAAVLGYLINVVFWLPALKEHQHLAVLSMIYSLAYCLVSVAIGVLMFHETLSLRQELGIVLALIAIGLMS
jgi:drug/metabolite transporter (DMT)-like permease